MDRNVRVVIILLVFIVVPFLVYAYLQVKLLKDDEKMADTIHEKQLETVLYSLNQYADDVMSQWVRRLSNSEQSIYQNANDMVIGNESIRVLNIRQMDIQKDSLFMNDYIIDTTSTRRNIITCYNESDSLISRLTNYLSAGFQKIQPVEDLPIFDGLGTNQAGIMVMVYDKDSLLYNALFIFDTNYLVEQVLGSKMQQLAQDDFHLAVLINYNREDNKSYSLYTADIFNINNPFVEKKLWILPDTYLAIQSKGESYSQLIRKRSKNNMYILFFALFVVLIGAYVIIRNIQSALKIAQLKSDFVSNVSHEIRTPLALIKMYAETLMLDRLPSEEKKQHYYQTIHHESGRLTYLVNNILDLSRIEANKKTYQMIDGDMNELTKQLYETYSFTFKENAVQSELILVDGMIPIKVDVQAFEEVLSNLIENAIKYSGNKKFIKIITTIEKGFGYCKVKDNGVGISDIEQSKIFDKFYRVEDALTQKTKGSGLGLSLAKSIMEAHEGKIEVVSAPNNGSTFILKFPLANNTV